MPRLAVLASAFSTALVRPLSHGLTTIWVGSGTFKLATWAIGIIEP